LEGPNLFRHGEHGDTESTEKGKEPFTTETQRKGERFGVFRRAWASPAGFRRADAVRRPKVSGAKRRVIESNPRTPPHPSPCQGRVSRLLPRLRAARGQADKGVTTPGETPKISHFSRCLCGWWFQALPFSVFSVLSVVELFYFGTQSANSRA
jgi:hypothetical protein